MCRKILIGFDMTKNTKVSLGMIFILGIMQISAAFADNNVLTRLDLQKSQTDSSVEVLLYTQNPYGDNIAVTKKSDNKYVILMPNLSHNASAKPNVSDLGDVVSDVDVKSVNDTGYGYTKITITTTKPVNIKTRLQKSMPVTPEQQAYRDLITKSRSTSYTPAYIPDSQTSSTASKPQTTSAADKTQKAEKTQQVKNVSQTAKTAEVKKQTEKTLTENKSKTAEKSAVQKKSNKAGKTETLPVSVKSHDLIAENTNKFADEAVTEKSVLPTVEQPQIPVAVTEQTAADQSVNADVQSKITGHKTSSALPSIFAMFLLVGAAIMFLSKLIRKSVKISKVSNRSSFIDTIAEKPSEMFPEAQYAPQPDFAADDYPQDDGLNWQERYQQYVSSSNNEEEPVQEAVFAADTNEISYINEKSEALKNAVMQTKSAQNGFQAGKFSVLSDSNAKTSAQPLEVPEPINISEAPAANPAPEPMPNYNNKVKHNTETSSSRVENLSVKRIEKQIEKLENERQQAESVKNSKLSSNKNDFEKLASRKKSEVNNTVQNTVEEDLVSLEDLLHKSPAIEKTNLTDEEAFRELERNFVHKEDDVIASHMINSVSSISKPRKFRAFENRMLLSESKRRNSFLNKQAKTVEVQEGKHVNLGYSQLHTSSRVLEGGNLRVGDLIAMSEKFLKTQSVKPEVVNNDTSSAVEAPSYSMSTIEEFLALDEGSSRVTAPEYLSKRVAESLAQVKPSMKLKKAAVSDSSSTNPISRTKLKDNKKLLEGLIVKSGFNIDANKGFYIVNLDGETALIGRIKDEIFVLKKFDSPIDKPIQVRQDNNNVYMVKADGFRSLVEVDNDKMGVLIEL